MALEDAPELGVGSGKALDQEQSASASGIAMGAASETSRTRRRAASSAWRWARSTCWDGVGSAVEVVAGYGQKAAGGVDLDVAALGSGGRPLATTPRMQTGAAVASAPSRSGGPGRFDSPTARRRRPRRRPRRDRCRPGPRRGGGRDLYRGAGRRRRRRRSIRRRRTRWCGRCWRRGRRGVNGGLVACPAGGRTPADPSCGWRARRWRGWRAAADGEGAVTIGPLDPGQERVGRSSMRARSISSSKITPRAALTRSACSTRAAPPPSAAGTARSSG